MVEGCRILAENHELYFITITCRGKDISYEYADEHYGEWTNRLLDACRASAKRSDRQWHYVQVTERQKRRHPHSHFITTFCPKDAVVYIKRSRKRGEDGKTINTKRLCLRSTWMGEQVIRSGLGEQYEITKVDQPEAASRYVAKYLFKSTIFTTDWPKGWKRIRYSHSFPQQEEKKTDAIVLLTLEDWVDLSYRAVIVTCPDLDVYEIVTTKLTGSDVLVKLRTRQ